MQQGNLPRVTYPIVSSVSPSPGPAAIISVAIETTPSITTTAVMPTWKQKGTEVVKSNRFAIKIQF